MFTKLFTSIFGNRNNRVLRKIFRLVKYINSMESEIEKLSDEQLKNKTLEFKFKIKQGISVDNLLPQVFAVVRESSKRILGMRHFDVQLLGGVVLHDRCIAEMRTGEGKTLTATLPAYLNALIGKGVHIVTVNDYLAKRDAECNRKLFEFLGMTVGVNLSNLSLKDKRQAYNADITYGTNHEYGFDYLRDNMVLSFEDRVQRSLYYALVDEVDSILIDEARTPLIISGPSDDDFKLYNQINKLVPYFVKQKEEDSDMFCGTGHFVADEKTRQISLTERGMILIEKLMVKFGFLKKVDSLYSPNNIMLVQYVISALRAHVLFFRNVDYIVKNNEIIIVDEHTGRIMPGRRWSDGLHQSLEAKEGLEIKQENQTLASITFQNYFRLYDKLSGMTGTADTEAFEFSEIYKLDTVVIPTNRPMIRKDFPDRVYITEKEKIKAIINDIKYCISQGRPVLVGTISIEKSELIASYLHKEGIKYKILNAKFHSMEAQIISQAGYPGSVTIATNMAGRGTDIVLGGVCESRISNSDIINDKQMLYKYNLWKYRHDKVVSAGGLHVIGTERHESRRIDNQLRGRSGRQGDPGSSRFYLSMEDNLMRIFLSDRIVGFMRKLGVRVNESIQHPWVSKSISNAQKKIENRNFDIRRQLLEYDNVINEQRYIIYGERYNLLIMDDDINLVIFCMCSDIINFIFDKFFLNKHLYRKNNLKKCIKLFETNFGFNVNKLFINNLSKDKIKYLKKNMLFLFIKHYQQKEKIIGKSNMRKLTKSIILSILDDLWKDHLLSIDYLRQGIHLRSYAQIDPKQEYKRESFNMFNLMVLLFKFEVISVINCMNVSEIYNIWLNKNNDTKIFSILKNKKIDYLEFVELFKYLNK